METNSVNNYLKKSNNSKFKLYKLSRDFYGYTRKYLIINIPKVHADLRIHIMDETYNLIKNILFSSVNEGNIRRKYLKECKVNISMIEMILEELNTFKYIKTSKFMTANHKLSDIKNYIYGWYTNEENK